MAELFVQQITEKKKRIKNSPIQQIAFKNEVNAKKSYQKDSVRAKNEMISTIGVITGAKTGMSKETKNNLSMSYRFSNLESLFYTQVME